MVVLVMVERFRSKCNGGDCNLITIGNEIRMDNVAGNYPGDGSSIQPLQGWGNFRSFLPRVSHGAIKI